MGLLPLKAYYDHLCSFSLSIVSFLFIYFIIIMNLYNSVVLFLDEGIPKSPASTCHKLVHRVS